MSEDDLANELIRILVDLLDDEPEMVGMLSESCDPPWKYVEAWHMVNNCAPVAGLEARFKAAMSVKGLAS